VGGEKRQAGESVELAHDADKGIDPAGRAARPGPRRLSVQQAATARSPGAPPRPRWWHEGPGMNRFSPGGSSRVLIHRPERVLPSQANGTRAANALRDLLDHRRVPPEPAGAGPVRAWSKGLRQHQHCCRLAGPRSGTKSRPAHAFCRWATLAQHPPIQRPHRIRKPNALPQAPHSLGWRVPPCYLSLLNTVLSLRPVLSTMLQACRDDARNSAGKKIWIRALCGRGARQG